MTEAKRPRREFRLPKWVLWAVLALIAVAVGLYGVAWIVVRPEADLERAAARLRAQGYATTLEEWNGPPISPQENAATEIDAADAWLVESYGSQGEWTAAGPWRSDLAERWWEDASSDDLLALDHLLAAIQPYLDRVEGALSRPRFRWPLVSDVVGPEVARLQRLTRLLQAQAMRGPTVRDRLRAIAIRCRVLRQVERPALITSMVALASTGSAVRDLRDVLEAGTVRAAEARRTLDDELRTEASRRLPDVVRSELVAAIREQRDLYAGRLTDERDRVIVPRLDAPTSRVLSLVWLGGPEDALDAIARSVAVDQLRLEDRLRAYRDIDESSRSYAHMYSLVWPIMAEKAGRADAALRLARVALAVKERHETTGAWPATLDEIRDAFPEGVPQDPFTDAPFAYEVRADVVRIASAGHVAGDPAPSAEELRDRTLVWEFPRR